MSCGDTIDLGAISRTFPVEDIHCALEATGRFHQRERKLPAPVVVYFVIAMTLLRDRPCREVLRILMEGLRRRPGFNRRLSVVTKSSISEARGRLGSEPMVMLHDQFVRPVATVQTCGAHYRNWFTTALDGTVLNMPDTQDNAKEFGRSSGGRGCSAWPQVRMVSLMETGTHVIYGSRIGPYAIGETTIARDVVGFLKKGMLNLADRNFYSFELWKLASATGADLLWRVKKPLKLEVHERLHDGSYLSMVYLKEHRKSRRGGVMVRVIEYQVNGSQETYRLITTILDPKQAPAEELAVLYHERWEIETGLDEFKTHMIGADPMLRSLKPELIRQEIYGLLMAYYAIRKLMHEAAVMAGQDPDRLSFTHTIRVVRRKLGSFCSKTAQGLKLFHTQILEEILEERVCSSRGRSNPRGVKRTKQKYPLRRKQPPIPLGQSDRKICVTCQAS